ncbi:glycosyl hydrolase family 31 [Halalkalibacillus sediminis]|uniref:Glycosyl hydrolase family 31 n=1 Tax=Halalkalibacillus sediminis TaxID=2018042 RepID=A0A2I0QU24_9BACI|nr:TIM-barrel domain-containing protein [Halalkalibacillus sediminis]PKR77826.1 glycosyl hydrolase family 31 [Halalkalibacillus sediminis]
MHPDHKYTELMNLYVSHLKGEKENVEKNLIAYTPNVNNDSIYMIATWLWVYQKHDVDSISNVKGVDTGLLIDYLVNQWSRPHSNIWENSKGDIYLSNISMVYAALQSTKNTQGQSYLQKTITELRDYVFDHLLSGGTVLAGANTREVSADELLAVVPYGLFSPEDLVMVEAVEKMVDQLDSPGGLYPTAEADANSASATAMLALYYLEKSDKERSLYYANIARIQMESDELAKVLMELFDFYELANREKDYIFHDPLGNENVYISQLTERNPHYPTLDESLNLRCQVESDEEIKNVQLFISSESRKWEKQEDMKRVEEENIHYYETTIDPLPDHGKYQYYYSAELVNGKEVVSEKFLVTTRLNQHSRSFKLLKQSEEEVMIGFGQNRNLNGLSFSFRGEGLDFNIVRNVELEEIPHQGSVELSSGNYKLMIDIESPSINLYKNEERIIATHPSSPALEWKLNVNDEIEELTFNWHSPETEKFYGFGERFNAIEQRGNVIDCYVYNQYRDQGTRTYIPIPFYMTNNQYGCFIDTNLYTSFDLASKENDRCSVTIEQAPEVSETNIHFYFGEMKKQIASYVQDTGEPTMVPAWALGPWMSSNNWDRQSIVTNEVELTNEYDIPATVIVLEQWSDEATYYMFNDAEYDLKHPSEAHQYEEMHFPEWGRWPDPKGMVEYLHENKLKLLLWQIPIQKYLNKQYHPLNAQDEAFMIENDFLVKNEDGTPYRIPENWFTKSFLMDFSNEEASEWWFKKRQYLIDIGVDGFKTDGGEFVFGKGLKFSNGQTGKEMRNLYPNDYIEAYYDFAQQNNGITFSRAGYIGAQNFPAHWAGDERSTFDAFKRSLIAGINAGFAGITFWGWDLAGFNGEIPSAELFMRSSSMAAFCPIMQYHAESKAEFSQDRTPWNIAKRTGQEQVIDVYRYFANLRMNLLPYIYQEAEKSSFTGIPMMRSLLIEYPEDKNVEGLYDEYLFGDSLLIAPVIEEGAVSRKVYLPEGTWFDFWTGEKFLGPITIEAEAGVDQIPVYVRSNQAMLLNVDKSEKLGSSVGNDITTYEQPLCKIYYEKAFRQKVSDHLGNQLELSVEETEEDIIIQAQHSIEHLKFEVIGTNKNVQIKNTR